MNDTVTDSETMFGSWCILELFGHRRLAGYVTEAELFGAKLLRIDIPTGEGMTTQYYGNAAVYGLTPTTEEIARAVAKRNQPEPVHRWELPPGRDTCPECGQEVDEPGLCDRCADGPDDELPY